MSILFDVFKILKGDSIGKVTEEVAKKRLDVCNNCIFQMHFDEDGIGKLTGVCEKCSCIVNQKTKYKDEKCPINKW